MEQLDTDGIIPAFGFGDASTKAKTVFPFKPEVTALTVQTVYIINIYIYIYIDIYCSVKFMHR